jgi:hypothetical protein
MFTDSPAPAACGVSGEADAVGFEHPDGLDGDQLGTRFAGEGDEKSQNERGP